jgi:CopA family copper-resistance protein
MSTLLRTLLALAVFLASHSWAEIREYEIDIRETEVNFTGEPVHAITLNGQIPAPTLEAHVGDRFRVTFNNHMDVETSIHWHGILLPNDQDGVPYLTTQPIAANSSFTYDFPITHHGTYWYHSHTGLQEQRGVYGALVFRPKQEQVTADREQVLVFSDWTNENPNDVMRNLKRDDDYYALKKDKVQSWDQVLAHGPVAIKNRLDAAWMRMPPMDLSDVGYDAFLVNGETEQQLPMMHPGETVRLRMVNASASSYQNIRFSGGPVTIVAADGVDVEPLRVKELTMAIAETYDVLVSVPDHKQYELRASSVDGTGYSSVWLGMGEDRVYTPDYQAPNPYLVSHSGHGEMDMSENHESMDMSQDHQSMEMEMDHSSHTGHQEMEMQHPAMQTMDHSGHDMHVMDASTPDESNVQQSLGQYENLRALEPFVSDPDQPVREVPLRLTGNMEGYRWSFNDTPLSAADRILISKGERVRFVMTNETMMNHPIHLHGHFFRVLTDQGDYSPWKHTVNVPAMSQVIIEFQANEEKDWFFHCHNLYHMKAGMARVIRYDDFEGDPSLPSTVGKVMSTDNHYYPFADVGLLSSKGEIALWSFNNRNKWSLNAEHDWEDLYEVEADYEYYIDRYLQIYTGIDYERHHDEDETLGVAGARYLLPGLIESEWRIDSEGATQVEFSSEIQLTKRTELEWFWNTDDEYGLELVYELNKDAAIVFSKEKDFGYGAGFELRF